MCAALQPDDPAGAPDGNALPRAAALGRYIVLGLVGRGAMGEVYAAYDPELDRKVAIKLLRAGGDARGRMRMAREAQAIAKLSHPNVVTVYDVGTFHDNVFIAMQFVDGCTLDDWMRAQPRPWRDVLEVFTAAGRGLAAAHDKNLVHRDFKPENVMVSPDGAVRVMDFGLARIEGDPDGQSQTPPLPASSSSSTRWPAAAMYDNRELSSTRVLEPTASALDTAAGPFKIALTDAGAIVGTPAYMAPEQFRGLPADARSDQFSFCVALHESLYGERPFTGHDLPALRAAVLDGVVGDPPPGNAVPAWIRLVVLRGLSVQPEARWPSMQALLAELESSATVSPRRRFAVDAAAKLAGIWEAPVGGRAVESEVKTEIRRAFLATGAHYAAETFGKVSALLDAYARSWSEMYTDACEATHLRGEQSAEVLDLRMASLGEALDGLKALSRVLRQATREVLENAVRAASALVGVERCADVKLLRAVVRPPENPATRAEVDRLRTWLAEVRVSRQVGRINEGLEQLCAIEREARRIDYAPLLAETLCELGDLHADRRDGAASAAALEEAVWAAEVSRHDEIRANATVQLVYVVSYLQQRFDAGEIWARCADALLRRIGGHDYLWGWFHNNHCALRWRQGRLAEAAEHARRAVAVKVKVHGPEGADVGISLGNLALILVELGEVEAAVPEIERAVTILETALGPEHPRTGVMLSNYGEILNRVGRFVEAREASARALTILEQTSAPDGLTLSFPLLALGVAQLGCGMAELALPVLERAAAIREAREATSSNLGEAHFALARALREIGQGQDRALALARRARAEYAADAPSPASTRELAVIERWLVEQQADPPAPASAG